MSNVIFLVYHEHYNEAADQIDRIYDCITFNYKLAEDYCKLCETKKSTICKYPDFYRVMARAIFDDDLTNMSDNTLMLQDIISSGLKNDFDSSEN